MGIEELEQSLHLQLSFLAKCRFLQKEPGSRNAQKQPLPAPENVGPFVTHSTTHIGDPDQLIPQINWVPSLHTPTRELCIKYLAKWTSIFVILQVAEDHNSTGRMQAKIHIQRVQPCACKFYIGLTSKADRLTGSGVKIPSWPQAGL